MANPLHLTTWSTLLVASLVASLSLSVGADEELPPGVQQILPRGEIPAVFEPRFVSADEAKIEEEAWILGVLMEGEARAYSLNLLNHHEIVNDHIGEKSFAAVW